MKVYFVRHASTNGTESRRLDGREVSISKRGVIEAEAVAGRLSGIKFDLIITSEYPHAVQTAEIIGKKLKKKVLCTKLLNEWGHAIELVGTKSTDPIAAKFIKESARHFDDPPWHYLDEENPTEFMLHGKKFLSYLSKRREKSVLIVMHGGFMCMLAALMIFGPKATPFEFKKIYDTFTVDTAGITGCEFVGNKWRIITWNDIAHLE